jgi:hypothetical protein
MQSGMVFAAILGLCFSLEGATVAAAADRPNNYALGVCGVAFDSQITFLVPPDDTTEDNAPAASTQLPKPCDGVVVGTFSANVFTPVQGSFISVDMRATCVGTGGYPRACTVGDAVLANPGHTVLQEYLLDAQSVSITLIWPRLRKGIWKFEVLPGGNRSAAVYHRNFTATALSQ